MPIRKGSQVLDVGCGYGATAIYLARKFGCSVDGPTLSSKQARVARRRIARAGFDGQANIVVCDVEQFEVRNDYDVIWVMQSSEHFVEKSNFISRAAQSLRPGGTFLIAAWTGSMTAPLVRQLAQLTLCPAFQPAETYRAQMHAAGLTVTAIRDLTQAVLPTWEICQRRINSLCLLWRFVPVEIREFISAIPLIMAAYRSRLMSYTVIAARKRQ